MEAKFSISKQIITCILTFSLGMALLFFQTSYAVGSDVVNSEKGQKKDLKIETKADPEVDEKKPEEKKYEYSPIGKPDPFISFLSKSGIGGRKTTSVTGRDSDPEEGLIPNKDPETELEKIEISKLTLTAVIRGQSDMWAMATDPKGRGYFLKKGTKIGVNSGVVDEIICEEQKTDFGVETVRKVIIKIPYRDRNREIIYRSVEMVMPYAKL